MNVRNRENNLLRTMGWVKWNSMEFGVRNCELDSGNGAPPYCSG